MGWNNTSNDTQWITIGTGLSFDAGTNTLTATGGGTLDGGGAAGQVAYWSDADTLTAEAGFEYDAGNNRLGVTNIGLGVAGATTGTTREIAALGTELNIELQIKSKGTEQIVLISDFLTIQNQAGTSRVDFDHGNNRFQRMTNQAFEIRGYENAAGSGGYVYLRAGSSSGSNGDGGFAYVYGGNGNGTGIGGHVAIVPGTGSTDGSVFLMGNNIAFFDSNSGNFHSSEHVLRIRDCDVAPAGDYAAGGFLYVEAGALKWRGSSGTTTTIANA